MRDLALTGEDPVPRNLAYAELERCADKMLTELSQLFDIGVRNFVITGLADVGLIPRYDRDGNGVLDPVEQMRSDAATEYSIYLDNLIRTEVVPALQALGATVTYVPLMDYVDENGNLVSGALSANLPMIAALHGLTTEELENNLLKYKDLIFFDQIHPNAQANALLGGFMQAHIDGTPWIETLPLSGVDVDYRLTATIAAAGEADKVTVSLLAGTTYTFEMLGTSSLGTAGTLADPTLRLLGPAGNVIGQNDDSGPGFDATLTFTAPTTGTYTVELDAVGSLTGVYVLQAAVVAGAVMTSGNTYVVNSSSAVVIESVDGVGVDTVKASVSYTLAAGSEIEVLRTTNDRGKGALNLTGNEFDQTIVGNSGSNVIDGKGGSDTLIGGGGTDKFAFTSSLGSGIDRISDFSVRDDTITLDDAVFTGLGVGALSAGAFAKGVSATQADDRIVYDPSSGKLYFDPDGVGGAAQVQFALLGTGLNLTSADFVIV